MPLYVWEKFTTLTKYRERSSDALTGGQYFVDIGEDVIRIGRTYEFDEGTGEFTVDNDGHGETNETDSWLNATTIRYVYPGTSESSNVLYRYDSNAEGYWHNYRNRSGTLTVYSEKDTDSNRFRPFDKVEAEAYLTKGEYVEQVTSTDQSAYPQDGAQDGYWYVFTETIPDVPSITVPDASMTGQQVSATWGGVDGVTSYKLERQVNGSGAWTQVYEGPNLSYEDTVQSTWTSVKYRVSAGIDGVYGTPLESDTVDIIPASALVISGSDGSLGTITAPVTYSVTSDTGNQITVTETINGHSRTLTPASGAQIAIPVSMIDPAADDAGEITIQASVQATSGTVTQTRSWTYTKTPLTLPTKAYRVEQFQGGEKDVMPITLAEAVMMPDGESVADKADALNGGYVFGRRSSSGAVTLPFEASAAIVWSQGNVYHAAALVLQGQSFTTDGASGSKTWNGSLNGNTLTYQGEGYNYIAFK